MGTYYWYSLHDTAALIGKIKHLKRFDVGCLMSCFYLATHDDYAKRNPDKAYGRMQFARMLNRSKPK